jgi:dihydrolipoamide dehydrogenase
MGLHVQRSEEWWMDVDVAVLGAGPGGYPAAIRAAQLGLSVAVIEKGELGGTCLNVGCIPTKAWVQSAHAFKDAHQAFPQLGVTVGEAVLDFDQVQVNKDQIVATMVGGVGQLLKANGCTVVDGYGRFTGPNAIAVDGGEQITFRHAVIATGSHPLRPPVEGIDHPKCVDSTGLLAIDAIPKRLIVLGGGVIGVEFASIFNHFGSEVTIVEMLDSIIPTEDDDAIKALSRAFQKDGIAIHTGARATRVEEADDGMVLHVDTAGEALAITGDLILVATGRGASVADIGLEAAGVQYDTKAVGTDASRRTNVPHIYAVGDVAGYWQLAHTAFREGEVAAENIAGHPVAMSGHVPSCIYTDPEVASVGLSEREAVERYGRENVVTGQFPYMAIARAAMFADKTGFFKSIHHAGTGAMLGFVIVGLQATDLINAGVIALDSEAVIETVGDSIAAHPTLSEGFKEAGLVALGRPIHMPPKKRR